MNDIVTEQNAKRAARRTQSSQEVDGEVIGGIGASFDTPENDVEIARAGLAALTP